MIRCPGCGLEHEAAGVLPARRGLRASGECEAEFAPVAALFYQDPALVPARQYVVDAYACQHPDPSSRTSVQTTALCLMTLDLVLECGFDVSQGSRLHARMMASRPVFEALEAPDLTVALTHRHVAAASGTDGVRERAREWAGSVWTAWAPHHALVRSWNRRTLPEENLPG